MCSLNSASVQALSELLRPRSRQPGQQRAGELPQRGSVQAEGRSFLRLCILLLILHSSLTIAARCQGSGATCLTVEEACELVSQRCSRREGRTKHAEHAT